MLLKITQTHRFRSFYLAEPVHGLYNCLFWEPSHRTSNQKGPPNPKYNAYNFYNSKQDTNHHLQK